mgnify:CR=1 FL=1
MRGPRVLQAQGPVQAGRGRGHDAEPQQEGDGHREGQDADPGQDRGGHYEI